MGGGHVTYGIIQIYDGGKLRTTLNAHTGDRRTHAPTPGHTALTPGECRNFVLAGSVRELQFDAMKLVSGSRDCTIRVFDLTRLEEFADEGERQLQSPANSLRNTLTVVCRTVVIGTEHTAEQELPHFVVGVPGGTQHADRVRSIHCSSRRIVSGGTLPRAP